MIRALNENYTKIAKKIPQQYVGVAWKTTLYLILFVTWVAILIGTFLLLK